MPTTATTPSHSFACAMIGRPVSWLNRVPCAVLALPLRFAVATAFWTSAVAKRANWETTISLFTDDYKVPLLPPVVAANMALAIELTAPMLLVLGLFTRVAALVLLGMTAVIENIVYPQACPTHNPSGAPLLGLLRPGPGEASFDRLLWRLFGKWFDADAERARRN